MRLGLSLGYQAAWTTPADHLAMAQEADRLGYSVVWAAEAYGSDSPSMLAWIAGHPSSPLPLQLQRSTIPSTQSESASATKTGLCIKLIRRRFSILDS